MKHADERNRSIFDSIGSSLRTLRAELSTPVAEPTQLGVSTGEAKTIATSCDISASPVIRWLTGRGRWHIKLCAMGECVMAPQLHARRRLALWTLQWCCSTRR
jgi:hypothetical protein